ncbi:MAG: phosphoribosyl-ATP diphosphatase [Desulfuromonadaceae bacterium]|nr:phosphoribosyl-ATP diphosphatase [Desulfuromonadaceae bacterium]
MALVDQVQFDKDGLVPAVVRDAASGAVLMLSHLNAEALAQTVASGLLHRYSRSKGTVVAPDVDTPEVVCEARLSCSGDCLLLSIKVQDKTRDCFSTVLWQDPKGMPANGDILDEVYRIVQQRRSQAADKSYVASLFAKGLDKILGKIGEEATETAVAGKGGDPEEVVSETADLFFHVLVLLGYYDLPPQRVYNELRRRFGVSGLTEKASRSQQSDVTQ